MFISYRLITLLTDLREDAIDKLVADQRLPRPEFNGDSWGWRPEILGPWVERYETERRTQRSVPLEAPTTHAASGVRQSIAPRLRFEVLLRDGFACRYCGRRPPETTLEVDHIVPVARGGATDLNNLQAACRECNVGKSDREIVQ